MAELDPLEVGLQRLDIPDPWTMAEILRAQRQRSRKPPNRGKPPTETTVPEDWKATLAVFLPQR